MIFQRFFRGFTSFRKTWVLLKLHFAPGPLEVFPPLQLCPYITQSTLKRVGGLQFGPWLWEAAALAKSRRAGRAPGRGSGGARPWAHLGPGGDRCWGGVHAGMGAQRGLTAAAAVSRLRRRPRWLGSGDDTGSAWTTSGTRQFYRV
jgi:hypothetical protein